MDKEFKEFLNKLIDQNKVQMAEQAIGIKYQREVATEDDDKREKQLDTVNANLVKIKDTLVKTNKDVKVLPKQLSGELGKNLSNLKIEEDKKTGVEQIQEIVGSFKSSLGLLTGNFKSLTSLFQGAKNKAVTAVQNVKDIVKTPAGFSVEKERFAKAFARTPEGSQFQAGGKGSLEVGREKFEEIVAKEKEIKTVEDRIKQSTDYGFQSTKKDQEELARLKKQLQSIDPRVKKPQAKKTENAEADNIVTPNEQLADTAKEDLAVSKDLLTTVQAQLNELTLIRQVLAPRTPSELQEGKKSTPVSLEEEKPSGVELPTPSIGGALSKIGKGALSVGKKILSAPGTALGRIAGGVVAVGAGAYTAYSGLKTAEANKQTKLEEIQQQLDSGQITSEQAAKLRSEVGNSATIEKGGAVGEGTGMAAGGIAGMKMGAAIGTMFGGPIGTGIGALAGGALGAFAGSKAGKVVGEYGGKAVNAVKSYFGWNKEEVAPAPTAQVPTTTPQTTNTLREKFEAMKPENRPGYMVDRTSVENNDLARRSAVTGGMTVPVISNNVSNNNNTSYVPMKPSPRPDYTGSALDRYQSRIAVY